MQVLVPAENQAPHMHNKRVTRAEREGGIFFYLAVIREKEVVENEQMERERERHTQPTLEGFQGFF